MIAKFSRLLIVLFLISGSLLKAQEIFELKGPRNVVAQVQSQHEGWLVNVSMIPVQSFSTTMNRKLNRKFSEHYALTALGKYLKKENFSVQSLRCQSAELQNGKFTASYAISGISDKIRKEIPKMAAPVEIEDSEEAVTELIAGSNSKLRELEQTAGEKQVQKANQIKANFELDVSELLRQINADNSLLSDEKEDLCSKLKKQRAKVIRETTKYLTESKE